MGFKMLEQMFLLKWDGSDGRATLRLLVIYRTDHLMIYRNISRYSYDIVDHLLENGTTAEMCTNAKQENTS